MALELNDLSELVESAKSGDRRNLSKLITSIESGNIPDVEASDLWTLGVTGPPGVGKSTLIGEMISHWTSTGQTVAILALDPSSPISGGSFLADRIRMEKDVMSDDVFVRSIASGNHPGGIPPNLDEICKILSYCGWDRIVIETVGTGQSEVKIVAFADRVLLVDGPDRGDIIQAEKAGILELADVIAVNKADLPGSESAAKSITLSLGLVDEDKRKVNLVSAIDGTGVEQLISDIESCEPNQFRQELRMKERILSKWNSLLLNHPEIDSYIEGLCDGSITVNEAIQYMIQTLGLRGD